MTAVSILITPCDEDAGVSLFINMQFSLVFRSTTDNEKRFSLHRKTS